MDGEYRKLLGYLPQDFGYYPDFTVYDYLMYIASIKGLRPAVAKRRTDALLAQVGLINMKQKKMKKLSGGMKRRAGIVQAMLNNPRILILDEPARGIDIGAKQEIYTLIEQMAHEGKGVIVISSEMPELIGISDRIITVHEGVIKGSLTGKEITQERIMMDLG